MDTENWSELTYQEKDHQLFLKQKKLAVFFPGIGYTVDKPLLLKSREIVEELGYEIKLLPYQGFPEKVKGDRARMVESFKIALEQTEEMLSDVRGTDYEDILFIGKSIGTIIAAKLASESPVKEKNRLILYTPLDDTFSFSFGKAIAFTGSNDPWVGKENSRIPQLCAERNIPCTIIPGGNHSLETKDQQTDARNMQMIMKETKNYIMER